MIELHWVPGIWKISENCYRNCFMCPQQYQSCIDVSHKQADSVKDRRGQVIHRLNHTCGGQTCVRNGTPMTFSNLLLCHSWRDIRAPSSGTIRHVLITPELSIRFLRSTTSSEWIPSQPRPYGTNH